MTPEQWQRIKHVMADALDQPDTKSRDAFVLAACHGDQALKTEIDELLAHADNSLEAVAQDMAGVARDDGSAISGARLGDYALVREIGRGGMGTIYLARRADEEFEKEVAIKILKRGTDTEEVLRRFRAERQILAQLDHPKIARLIDAGTSPDGLPYFVMEYVDGIPITDFCDRARLGMQERVELFLKVCGALHFAHQNLVVHRDLKPGNILITANGEPKLLDFGIAKLLAPGGSDFLLTTIQNQQRFTPAYASPEQVRGDPVTTGSDVYSLGALLYELLVGAPPHRFANANPSPTELFHVIVEEEPLRASVALATRKNSKLLAGDLDNILGKALQKEPVRRYSSVTALAEDLRRSLDGRPVRARPSTIGYRTAKFVRRNKPAVAAGAMIFITLVGGIVLTNAQRVRAERERARAESTERQNRELLYAAQMSLAYQAWESANVGRAIELLENQKPAPGEEDLRGFEWHLLARLVKGNARTLRGAADQVSAVAFSPDGSEIAVASWDGSVKMWNGATGELCASFPANPGYRVNALSFSPDGKYLALAFVQQQTSLTEAEQKVFASGTATSKASVQVWDAETGQPIRTLALHRPTAWHVVVRFSPDNTKLAVATNHPEFMVFDVSTGEKRAIFEMPSVPSAMAFSPDGSHLVIGGHDGMARFRDTRTWQEIAAVRGNTHRIYAIDFSPDGKLLATSGGDGDVKLFDVASRGEIATIRGQGLEVYGIAFSPDGKSLAVGAYDNTVSIYDVATQRRSRWLRGHTDYISSVAFSPDGKTLASGSADRTVKLWNLTAASSEIVLDAHKDWAWSVAFSPDGRTLASGGKDATAKLWDVESGQEVWAFPHGEWVNAVAFSPDGTKLATGSDDTTVRVWETGTGRQQFSSNDDGHIMAVVFSPDGKRVASCTGHIKLHDTTTGHEVAMLQAPHWNMHWTLAFSPDGKYLAVGEGGKEGLAYDGDTVRMWDVAAGQIAATLRGHTFDVRAVAFSPDGKLLASGSFDGSIKLWEAGTWREVATLRGHKVISLAFSPDGKRIVSGSPDKTVKLWDVTTKHELCTLNVPSEINSVAFSPDNRAIAVAAKDGKIRLWFAGSPEASP